MQHEVVATVDVQVYHALEQLLNSGAAAPSMEIPTLQAFSLFSVLHLTCKLFAFGS